MATGSIAGGSVASTKRWEALRVEFVTGPLSDRLPTFAAQHEIPYTTVRDHARRENWRQARRVHHFQEMVRRNESWLPFARKNAIIAAGEVLALCKSSRIEPTYSLWARLTTASRVIEQLASQVVTTWHSRESFASAKAGKPMKRNPWPWPKYPRQDKRYRPAPLQPGRRVA